LGVFIPLWTHSSGDHGDQALGIWWRIIDITRKFVNVRSCHLYTMFWQYIEENPYA
jgi:hypothetical protein